MYEKRVNQPNGNSHPNLNFSRLAEEAELIHHSVGDEIEIRMIGGELHVRVPEHVTVTNDIKHFATTVIVVGKDGKERLVSHKRPRKGSDSKGRYDVDILEFPYFVRESLFWAFGEAFAQFANNRFVRRILEELFVPSSKQSVEAQLRRLAILHNSKNVEYRLIGGELHVHVHGDKPLTSEIEKNADIIVRVHTDGRKETLKHRDGPLIYPWIPASGTEWAYSSEHLDTLVVRDVLDE